MNFDYNRCNFDCYTRQNRGSQDQIVPTRYTTYNLIINSELSLPELVEIECYNSSVKPDITIKFDRVSPKGIADGKQCGPFHWISEKSVWLHITDVCRFLIEDGDSITIDPEPQADEDSIRLFLLGSAIGAILFQRGYLVLHGNSIRIGDNCMICVGDSGAGKSTLAAGFMKRGYDILADDVVPIDENCCAIRGFPRIKLWQDVATQLDIDTQSLRRIMPNVEKFNLPLKQTVETTVLPVKCVFILSSHDQEDIYIEPILGMKKFEPLLANTYRNFYLEGMGLKSQHLQLCGNLARHIHLAKVSRPKAAFKLDELMERLLEYMAAYT